MKTSAVLAGVLVFWQIAGTWKLLWTSDACSFEIPRQYGRNL